MSLVVDRNQRCQLYTKSSPSLILVPKMHSSTQVAAGVIIAFVVVSAIHSTGPPSLAYKWCIWCCSFCPVVASAVHPELTKLCCRAASLQMVQLLTQAALGMGISSLAASAVTMTRPPGRAVQWCTWCNCSHRLPWGWSSPPWQLVLSL